MQFSLFKSACYCHRAFLCILLLLSVFACNPVEHVQSARQKTFAHSPFVSVGLVWDEEQGNSFRLGAELAISQLNAQGGLLGKRLVPLFRAENCGLETAKGCAEIGRKIAHDLVKNPSVVTVIGHSTSSSAIAGALTYVRYGLLFISPAATTPLLSHLGFWQLLRTVEDDRHIAKSLAEYVREQNLTKIAIVAERGEYGEGLALEFSEVIGKSGSGAEIVLRRLIDPKLGNFIEVIEELRRYKPDAVLLAASLRIGADFLRDAKRTNFSTQFIAGDGLFSSSLTTYAGRAAEGLVVASSVGSLADKGDFSAEYNRIYGELPDGWAEQGYDAVMLFAHGVTLAKSFNAREIATMLKHSSNWKTASGAFQYANTGEVVQPVINIEEFTRGAFHLVSKQVVDEAPSSSANIQPSGRSLGAK